MGIALSECANKLMIQLCLYEGQIELVESGHLGNFGALVDEGAY